MTDDIKIYSPTTISDQPLPESQNQSTDSTQSTSGVVITTEKISDNNLPKKMIARETISQSINTKTKKITGEYQFIENGAIKIGKYENGVSGEMKLSPDGVVAKNKSGDTTFAIDGDTGDAVFKGSVQAGTIITGAVEVGNQDILIDGEKERMTFYDENGIPVIVIGKV